MNIDRNDNGQLDMLARPGAGARRQARALDEHERNKKEAINWLRRQMLQLFNDRRFNREPKIPGVAVACVNADDVRRVYEASSFPPAYATSRAFYGSVLRGREWMHTGHRVKSQHPANNARKIECYMPA